MKDNERFNNGADVDTGIDTGESEAPVSERPDPCESGEYCDRYSDCCYCPHGSGYIDTDTDTDVACAEELIIGHDANGEPITIGYELPLPKVRHE